MVKLRKIIKYLYNVVRKFTAILQGSKGMRQWPIDMCIPFQNDKQNYHFCR